MKVCEIFTSIQGEGSKIGTPCQFLRLSGCNLDCSWCDTKYSWKEGHDRDVYQLYEGLNTTNLPLVVTGGEPLLQQDELVFLFRNLGRKIWMETNGTIRPGKELLSQSKEDKSMVEFWSVSPKFDHINKEVLYDFTFSYDRDFAMEFKWVVSNEKEWKKVESFRNSLFDVPFVVQPQGSGDLLKDLALLKDLWSWQKADPIHNTRVLPQLHRLLYGNERAI
jgi:7-carboxy-7-deazaguanine synthase